jgi:hypothetical protein
MTTENKTIYAAFVKAQAGFAPALKTSTNPHFKSRYADLGACVEAVIDSLHKNGIGLIQKSHPNESGVSIETVFIHESGESMSGGVLHVPAAKSDPQGYGSALTYARRYSLMASCGIAPEDDDGNNASAKTAQVTPRPAPPVFVPISKKNEETLRLWAGGSAEEKALVARVLAKGDVIHIEDLPDSIAVKGIQFIKTELAKNEKGL